MSTTTAPEIAPAEVAPLDERTARIAWSLMAEPGDVMSQRWFTAYGTAAAAFASVVTGRLDRQPDGTAEQITTALDQWRARVPSPDRIAQAVKHLDRFGIASLIPGDEGWPTARMDAMGDSQPIILYIKGPDMLALTRPAIAVVGSRAATGYGEHVTMELVHKLADRATIISGGAYGIDGMAHRATLASGGRTIAVLANGLDRYYPSGHEALLTRIVETGALVSELPPLAPPSKWRFLKRNRLIAALSDAVIVTEAGARSGALHTAENARELGIPVGAVPGPITSAASAGTHQLIRSGAALVTSGDEIAALAGMEATRD